MDTETQDVTPADSWETVDSTSTVDSLRGIPLPTRGEAAGEVEDARRASTSGEFLHSVFNFVTTAATSFVGFLGEQARNLASVIAASDVVDDIPELTVWDSEQNGVGPVAEVGDPDRPRRGRRPSQPPGLVSRALRELRDAQAEGEVEMDTEATAAQKAGVGARLEDGTDSRHVFTQLSCSKAP